MIILLAPERSVARALTSALLLKKVEGTPLSVAEGEALILGEIGLHSAEAVGRAGYLLGSYAGERDAAVAIALSPALPASRFTPALPLTPESAGHQPSSAPGESAPPVPGLALQVRGAGATYYPDPLICEPARVGTLFSPLIADLIGFLSDLRAWDQIYPLVLGSGRLDSAARGIALYLERLEAELTESSDPLGMSDERLLEELAGRLRLSRGSKNLLYREARFRALRAGTLPEELIGYAALTAGNRREGERLLKEIITILREESL